MVAVPFIYFSILLLYVVKKRTFFCVASLLLLVYVIISFFSIVIEETNAYDNTCPNVKVTLIPTILYCVLLTIAITPFLAFHDEKIKNIGQIRDSKYINFVVYVFFMIFVLLIVLTGEDIIRNQMLLSVNENLKADIRLGRVDAVSLSGFSLQIAQKCRLFSSASLLLLPIFFYSLCFWKKKWYYNMAIFIGSMSTIPAALLQLDRSRIVYWGMVFVASFAFFYKFLPQKKKKIISIIGLVFLSFIVLYIGYMNLMRFSNKSYESDHYLISYLGQSFLNFCTNYERINLHEYSIVGAFPILNKLLGGEDLLYWYDFVSRTHRGLFIMNFSTFLGEFISEIGVLFTILWTIGFNRIAVLFLKHKNQENISFFKMNIFFVLLLVPYCGIFAHYFHEAFLNLATLGFVWAVYISSKK